MKKSICTILLISLLGCGEKTKESTSPNPTPENKNKYKEHERVLPVFDNIYGQEILSNESWHVRKGLFYHKDKLVQLRGINWFGFETSDLVVHGLWTGRNIESYLKQVADLGFNALRIPIAPEVFNQEQKSTHGKILPLDNLLDLLGTAKKYNLYILLDLHTCNYKAGIIGNPLKCENYGLSDWIDTLKKMTSLSLIYDNILGIDIFNEPHAISWKEWRNLASIAAKEILTLNPRILVFIEGVCKVDTEDAGNDPNWGGNLVEAARNPPDVPVSRLVFAPHTYGPSTADQKYFTPEAGFPENMPKIWDSHFGYLTNKNYTLSVTEFGGRYKDKDKTWQDTFVSYLIRKDMKNFFYWSLNPNSGDTGGLLNEDWQTINEDKYKLLKLLF